MATFVYLVYPKGRIPRAPFLTRLGIGLLEVDDAHQVNELIKLSNKAEDLYSVLELHPTDFPKEQHLADYIRMSSV